MTNLHTKTKISVDRPVQIQHNSRNTSYNLENNHYADIFYIFKPRVTSKVFNLPEGDMIQSLDDSYENVTSYFYTFFYSFIFKFKICH